jgi:hypothetical protein
VGPATVSVGLLKLFRQNPANFEAIRPNMTASQGKTEGLKGPLDEVERSNKVSERSWADVIGSVASLVDALACLTFLILPADVTFRSLEICALRFRRPRSITTQFSATISFLLLLSR